MYPGVLTSGITHISSSIDQLYLKGNQHFKLLPPSFQERITILSNNTINLFNRSNLDRIALLFAMRIPISFVKKRIFDIDLVMALDSHKKNKAVCSLKVSALNYFTWDITQKQSENWKYRVADLTSYGLACSIVGIAVSKKLGGTAAGGLGLGLTLFSSETTYRAIKTIGPLIYNLITKLPLNEVKAGISLGTTTYLILGRNLTKGMLIGGGLGFAITLILDALTKSLKSN